jgi:hypothetical protein
MAGSWMFLGRKAGGHVHVTVSAGTPGHRAKLGELTMSEAEWAELVDLVEVGVYGLMGLVDAGHREARPDFETLWQGP